MNKRSTLLLVLFIFLLLLVRIYTTSELEHTSDADNDAILQAYANKNSNIIVSGSGRVIKKLRDDLKGSKHQKFIIELDNNHTLLISHNIDLAPRIKSLQQGDLLLFKGEYEWNRQGGVVHWTHRDPRGKHPNGWIKHNGKFYQ
jgi:hypothetical protein